LSEDQYKDFQLFLAQHAGSGNIIKDSGGIRKMRWKLERKKERVAVSELSIIGKGTMTKSGC